MTRLVIYSFVDSIADFMFKHHLFWVTTVLYSCPFFFISLWFPFFVDFRLSLLKIRRILLLRGTTKPLGRKRKRKRSQQEKQQRKLLRKLQTRNQSAISVSWIYRLALSVKHGSTHLLTGAVFSLFCNTYNFSQYFCCSIQPNILIDDRSAFWLRR